MVIGNRESYLEIRPFISLLSSHVRAAAFDSSSSSLYFSISIGPALRFLFSFFLSSLTLTPDNLIFLCASQTSSPYLIRLSLPPPTPHSSVFEASFTLYLL